MLAVAVAVVITPLRLVVQVALAVVVMAELTALMPALRDHQIQVVAAAHSSLVIRMMESPAALAS
jgi:hypothetical protein